MYELKVVVGKVLGTCTADPPMKRGDHFFVRDGDITIPEGGFICLWALQSLLPLITPKEREICEAREDDWMWRVHHAQCPDPNGRVVFKVERVATLDKRALELERTSRSAANAAGDDPVAPDAPAGGAPGRASGGNGQVRDLRVVVEQVKGRCTSQMKPGDCFVLRGSRLYIPHGQHFCLYALHAALPLLPAKQRSSHAGDWLAEDHHVICPDPAGNVVMRIETDKP
jgi:uncharacterized repeat protein (TIGR04076 family)